MPTMRAQIHRHDGGIVKTVCRDRGNVVDGYNGSTYIRPLARIVPIHPETDVFIAPFGAQAAGITDRFFDDKRTDKPLTVVIEAKTVQFFVGDISLGFFQDADNR